MATCELCGEPMPPGEEMFKYHGHSGPCPKAPQSMTIKETITLTFQDEAQRERFMRQLHQEPDWDSYEYKRMLRRATAEPVQHASDCAKHDGPALPAGECNCGAEIA